MNRRKKPKIPCEIALQLLSHGYLTKSELTTMIRRRVIANPTLCIKRMKRS